MIDAGKGKDGLEVIYVGNGGLNELKQRLANHRRDIMFFLLLVNTTDDGGSSRAKYIYGRFMGSKVNFMEKAKVTVRLGEIAEQFKVKHLSMDANESMHDWDPETLGKALLKIGGAHKPTQYNFGRDAIYNCKKKKINYKVAY